MRWSLVACVLAASPLLTTGPCRGQGAVDAPCPPGRVCEPVPADELESGAAPGSAAPPVGVAPASAAVAPAAHASQELESQPGPATPLSGLTSEESQPGPATPSSGSTSEEFRTGSPAPSGHIYLYAPPPPSPPPGSPGRATWRRQLGVATHLEWALLGSGASEAAAMGGLGAAFRLRPLRAVALDAGLDLVGGRDWEGNRRREYLFSGSALLYFNPADVAQIYLVTGLMLARARVTTASADAEFGERPNPKYSYFGGQMGLGLEWRLREELALNFALLGFLRGRTDSEAERVPEFVHGDTGVGTNSSGGGLLRGGVTFYF